MHEEPSFYESPESEFEKLVDLYYPSLYRFAVSLTRRESDACDLTQQTFYIWAAKGDQLLDRAKAKSWLFTTLHREYLRQYRRAVRFPNVALPEAEGEMPSVAPEHLGRLDGRAVLEALAQVSEHFQAAVALFYLEDYSYAEIAEVLEVPIGTVKSRIARGIAQLQRLLSDREARLLGKELRE